MSDIASFDKLVDLYGPIEAMRILEAIESMIESTVHSERMRAKPQKRFNEAISHLIDQNVVA